MEITGVTPGPVIGFTLNALLDEVLEDPSKNTQEYMEKRAKELAALPIEELKALGEKGKESQEEANELEIKKIRRSHKVQ
jgi:hypothetical protein